MRTSTITDDPEIATDEVESPLSRRALWRWPTVIVACGGVMVVSDLAAVYDATRPGPFTPEAASALVWVLSNTPTLALMTATLLMILILPLAFLVRFRTRRWPVRLLACGVAGIVVCVMCIAGSIGAGTMLYSAADGVTRAGDSRACYVEPARSYAFYTEQGGLQGKFEDRVVSLDSLLVLQPGSREVVCPYGSDDLRFPVGQRTAAH